MSNSIGNVQISIHAALVDTRNFDTTMLQEKVQEEIIRTYHSGGILKNIMYYFAEKEIKENLMKKYSKQLNSNASQNVFFNPERTAFAHRSNISYHYKLGDDKQKSGATFSNDTLQTLCNNYILSLDVFAGLAIQDADKKFMEEFSTLIQNDKDYQDFKNKHCKNCLLSSDLMYQLKSYKANIQLITSIMNDESLTVAHLQKLVAQHINNYQQIPLFLRFLEINFVDQASWPLITSEDAKQKIKDLTKPIYDIHMTIVSPTETVGSIKLAGGSYGSWITNIGLAWKWLPRWLKLLILGGLIAATALLGGRAILLLPLIIFFTQFIKTKADYLHNIQGYINRFVTNNTLSKQKKDSVTATKVLGKSANDTKFIYHDLQPSLLDNPTTATELAKNILSNSLTTIQQEQLKHHVDAALAHITHQNTKKIPSYVVNDPRTKEQEAMVLYKSVVFGASLVGYVLNSKEGIHEYQTSRTFVNVKQELANTAKKSSSNFGKYSTTYALQDGLLSGVVSGFTGWLGGYLFSPGAAVVSAYTSSQLVGISVENDSPLYDWLLDNDMDPASYQFSDEDISEILRDNKDIRLEGEQFIYTSDAKVLDVKLIEGIKEILPEDTYNQFIAKVSSDQPATLWDTLTGISGYTQGNEYSHEIVEQIWKTDENGGSEIFNTSVYNGFPVNDMNSSEWSHIMKVVDNTYDYEGFEAYSQWTNKQRIGETMQKLSENNFSINDLQEYTQEQRAVLTHAAFVYLDTNDLKDILLDYSGQEEVVGHLVTGDTVSTTGSGTEVGSGQTQTGTTQGTTNPWFDFGQPEYTGQIQATPLPYGKNTLIKDAPASQTTPLSQK